MKVIKTNEVEHQHIFGLIVGSSGSGKTSLSKTLNHDETIIFSAESGLLSIHDVSIDAIEIKTYQDLLDAFMWIDKQDKYKNLFIDSLTEIGQILFNELKPNYTKSQTFGLYDEYSFKMTRFIKALRDYKKLNIYCTALDAVIKKDFEEITSIDLIQKSLASKLPALFDEVFYLSVIEKDEQKHRVLLTDNKYHNFLKDRSGKLDAVEKPDLNIITNKIFKGEN
jgi:ABC-type oligopeptide transport system ATPase subunit